MALIDLDKFVESLMWMWDSYKNNPLFKNPIFNDIKLALDKQGLVYKDGKIVKTQRRVSAEAKEDGYSESEDDRIRETLIDYFENYKTQEEIGIKTFFGIQTDDIIAWLEKQTNTIPSECAWSEEDEYMLNETIQHLEELIRIDKAKHLGCDVQYYQRDIDWLRQRIKG